MAHNLKTQRCEFDHTSLALALCRGSTPFLCVSSFTFGTVVKRSVRRLASSTKRNTCRTPCLVFVFSVKTDLTMQMLYKIF